MVLHHMHSNISPRVHSFVAKEAKFLRRLSLTCLKISWSAWRFGKRACDSAQMDSGRGRESESHRVFPRTPFVLSGAPPNQRRDCDGILQTVTWGKCLCHSAEDEDGEFN